MKKIYKKIIILFSIIAGFCVFVLVTGGFGFIEKFRLKYYPCVEVVTESAPCSLKFYFPIITSLLGVIIFSLIVIVLILFLHFLDKRKNRNISF